MPALFLDCSSIWRHPSWNTGIHRVVRNAGRGLLEHSQSRQLAYQALPVAWDERGQCRQLRHIPTKSDRPLSAVMDPIRPEPGDCYLALDAGWDHQPLRRLSSWWLAGVVMGVVQYDVVPLEYPSTCASAVTQAFERWFAEAAAFADFHACVSRSTLAGVRRQLQLRHPWRTIDGDSAFSFRLGSNFLGTADPQRPSSTLGLIFNPGRRVFLSIGALEPRRKNQALILDAFDMLWEHGCRDELLLIGVKGWQAEGLVRRITRHAEWGRRLHWRESVTDEDLAFAYSNATGIIAASVDEGAALPLVEAGGLGVRLFASDIPIFHEIAGDRAQYFHRRKPEALAALLQDASLGSSAVADRREPPAPWASWGDSTDELMEGLARVATVKRDLRQRMRRSTRILADARRLLPAGRSGTSLASGLEQAATTTRSSWRGE